MYLSQAAIIGLLSFTTATLAYSDIYARNVWPLAYRDELYRRDADAAEYYDLYARDADAAEYHDFYACDADPTPYYGLFARDAGSAEYRDLYGRDAEPIPFEETAIYARAAEEYGDALFYVRAAQQYEPTIYARDPMFRVGAKKIGGELAKSSQDIYDLGQQVHDGLNRENPGNRPSILRPGLDQHMERQKDADQKAREMQLLEMKQKLKDATQKPPTSSLLGNSQKDKVDAAANKKKAEDKYGSLRQAFHTHDSDVD